ncbi:MAG TPA: DUF533 domain-containing protein [Verrucomicrobiota bacterium]|nr:DUF533 domain-containing protein [Verrucomicrobiales bacterium]HRI15298.1 DUF533 domain-containing protein [Verrucomicrobiota bacterium]
MDAMKLLGSLLSNQALASGLGSQLLGSVFGGGGQARPPASGGGLGNLLGAFMGGGAGGADLAGLLASVMGGAGGTPTGGGGLGGLAGLLGGLMAGGGEAASPGATVAPARPADANGQATVLIRAMVNAAKSDGRIDEQEQQKILAQIGHEVSSEEVAFLQKEFAAPLDVAEFARSVPPGMQKQVYLLSLTSIDLDSQNEANYLGELARGLGIDPATCNQIHDQVGAQRIFA